MLGLRNGYESHRVRLGSTIAVVRRLLQNIIERSAGFFFGGVMSDEENILSDVPERQPSSAHPWDSWKCSCCGFFVYNLDKNGYPSEGAPSPHFINRDYPVVCSVCWAEYVVLDKSEYFTKINKEAKESDAEKFRRNKKLGPGGNYFP